MNSNSQNNTSQSGFTLLEVLISMAVLVFISFAIYQATIETFKLRDTLSADGDFYNSIRLSTAIMHRDIAMMYSPTIGLPDSKPSPNPAGTTPAPNPALTADDLGQSFTFWAAAVNANGIRPAHFIGTENKLSFIAVSHARVYKDTAESEFSKVTYDLKRDESNTRNPDTMVLVKTESSNAFANDDVRDLTNHSYELLHGIKKLSYSYYQRDGNTWKTSKSWDSDKEENKNAYPDIIEMKIEVISPKKQTFQGIFKFRPEIPLNGLNPST